jgi:hypothetical protein
MFPPAKNVASPTTARGHSLELGYQVVNIMRYALCIYLYALVVWWYARFGRRCGQRLEARNVTHDPIWKAVETRAWECNHGPPIVLISFTML